MHLDHMMSVVIIATFVGCKSMMRGGQLMVGGKNRRKLEKSESPCGECCQNKGKVPVAEKEVVRSR